MSGMNVSLLIQFLTKAADKVRNEVGGIRKQFQELRTGFRVQPPLDEGAPASDI
jgi:hypothetical protein